MLLLLLLLTWGVKTVQRKKVAALTLHCCLHGEAADLAVCTPTPTHTPPIIPSCTLTHSKTKE